MTRERAASYGVGTPPPLDRWIDAVLMLYVSLVQGVATTFGMRFSRQPRDWHTGEAREALPQTKPDIHIKEATPSTESRAALRRTSLVANPKGQANAPSEDHNRKSPNHGTGAEPLEACNARVPGEGRGPVSAQGALPTRTPTTVIPAKARHREVLKPRTYARRRLRLPSLGAGSRSRASGMTPSTCVQIRPF